VITAEATYRERVEVEVDAKGQPASVRTGAPGAIRSLRRRLGVALPDIAERLAEVNGRLGRMRGEADGYAGPLKPLDYAGGLSKQAWPDRALAGGILKDVKELREWGVKQAHPFLLRAAASAEALGQAPAAAAAAGAEAPAPTRTEEVARYKRYRVYLEVVRPAEDRAELVIEVREAPALPRAPWLPPESREPAEPPDAGGRR
jgi:hypothetical protein